jgi:hypothetical protein
VHTTESILLPGEHELMDNASMLHCLQGLVQISMSVFQFNIIAFDKYNRSNSDHLQVSPSPKNPELQMHRTLLLELPGAHSLTMVASVWQEVHALHTIPSPKYPALHVHTTVSILLPTGHSFVRVESGEHCLQAWQLFPSKNLP